MTDPQPLAELLAALSYGERLAAARAQRNVALAPDDAARKHQQSVADRERDNAALIEARLRELGSPERERAFHPFFDAFFERTEPADWIEAQAWHYVGDALVRDFADALAPTMDRVSAEVVGRALTDRDDQEMFALDAIAAAVDRDPGVKERVAAYARRVTGEALTQTRHALDASEILGELLGGEGGQKLILLGLLQRHRERLDRLGIEPVE